MPAIVDRHPRPATWGSWRAWLNHTGCGFKVKPNPGAAKKKKRLAASECKVLRIDDGREMRRLVAGLVCHYSVGQSLFW